VVNPANTILDGGSTGRVLELIDNHGGDIQVDCFTVQNGNTTLLGAGISATSSFDTGKAGDVIITNNIIKGNTTTQGGGGVYARSYAHDVTGTAGTFILVNNVITGNSANIGGGIFASSYSVSGTPGQGTVTNNTITGNSATTYGGGAFLYAYSSSVAGGVLNVYNNIIWGNTSPAGADIRVTNNSSCTTNGYNNDYTTMDGTWDNEGGNINADPLFIGGGNYRLSYISPCIDTGLNSAPSIPATDFDGNVRIIDGNNDSTATVDMGAAEYLCSNPFKIGTMTYNYPSIHASYESMSSGTIMQIRVLESSETLALDEDKTVTLKGGYGCDFSTNAGSYTIVNGSLTISKGTVTIENIIIKQEQLLF
jgi:hypothetical protein